MKINDYMNLPEIAEITEADIIRAYRGNSDVKSIARQYDMNTNKVKGILRQAGVLEPAKPVKSKLQEVGMNEKDFYKE